MTTILPGVLRRLSLDDLFFLEALVRLGSLKTAADEFGLTRASASRTLARLREATGDPLFIRSNPNLVPTPEARRLSTAVRRLKLVARELEAPRVVAPSTLSRHFFVGAGENATYAFCMPVMERLAIVAPNVRISIKHFTPERLFEQLQNGRLDMAFFPQEALPPHFECMEVATNNIVAMVRVGHPLLSLANTRALRIVDLEPYPKIRVDSAVTKLFRDEDASEFESFYREYLEDTVPTIPYFLSALELLSRSNSILSVALRTAEAAVKRFPDCAILPIPPQSLVDFKVRIVWHERLSHDPDFQWLRGMFSSTLLELENRSQQKTERRSFGT